MHLRPGARLGRYRIDSLLGQGGMGEVYRARDSVLERTVALKILPPHLTADETRVHRFTREARAASALSHPHILTVYDVGLAILESDPPREPQAPLHYISMEFLDGETLRAKLATSGDPQKRLEWLVQVAEALGKAHEAGIIHRDLKPENIMISRDGYAKVLDFGLAKLVDSGKAMEGPQTEVTTASFVRTEEGRILGTVGYMSPEQVEVRTTVQLLDATADRMLWSAEFEGDLSDVMNLQGRITAEIAKRVSVELGPDRSYERVDQRVLELYFRGRHALTSRRAQAMEQAIRDFEQAVAIDPTFAPAHAGIADCWILLVAYGDAAPREAYAKAKQSILAAVELDPVSSEAFSSLGMLHFHADWNWAAAEASFREALRLNPNNSEALHAYNILTGKLGRHDEAVQLARKANEVDPLGKTVTVANALASAGRDREAIEEYERVLTSNPSHLAARVGLAGVQCRSGNFEEALRHIRMGEPYELPIALASAAAIYAISGDAPEARRKLSRMAELARHRRVSPFMFALVEAALGETDRAIASLERAYQERDPWLLQVTTDKNAFVPLDSDPRFIDLTRRLNLQIQSVPQNATTPVADDVGHGRRAQSDMSGLARGLPSVRTLGNESQLDLLGHMLPDCSGVAAKRRCESSVIPSGRAGWAARDLRRTTDVTRSARMSSGARTMWTRSATNDGGSREVRFGRDRSELLRSLAPPAHPCQARDDSLAGLAIRWSDSRAGEDTLWPQRLRCRRKEKM